MIVIQQDRMKKASNLKFFSGSPWADERFYYLHISIQIVAVVSLICCTAEIVFGCWSLNILSNKVYDRMEMSSTKNKHVAIGVAIFLTLSARITALIIWIRSTRNENLRCYSVTSHCTFISVFVMLGLGSLLLYFLSVTIDLSTSSFRANTEVLLAFVYIAGFDILFSATFGFAVTSDLQYKIRSEWQCGGREALSTTLMSRGENWVRPCHNVPKWSGSATRVTEVYV